MGGVREPEHDLDARRGTASSVRLRWTTPRPPRPGRGERPVMTTYDPQHALDGISRNAVAVLGIGGLSILAMFVFFVEAARMGRRDRVYPMVLWMTVLWMTALWWPHDGSYLLHFGGWFGGAQSHWFTQMFWFAIVVTFCAESVYAWQTIRYGWAEISPGRPQREHTLRVLGALGAGVVSWALVPGALDDPLYLLSFVGTLLWGGPSSSAVLGRRSGGRGQSQLEWVAYSAMAVLYSITSIFFFGGGFFHSWAYVGICVASCVWSFVLIADVRRAGVPVTSWSSARSRCPSRWVPPSTAGDHPVPRPLSVPARVGDRSPGLRSAVSPITLTSSPRGAPACRLVLTRTPTAVNARSARERSRHGVVRGGRPRSVRRRVLRGGAR